MPRPKKGWGAKFVPTTKVKRAGTPQKDIYFMRRYDWRISPFYHKLVKDDRLNYDEHIYDSWDLYRANWALIETYYDNYLEGL